LLHDYLVQNPLPGEALVPVPLHRKRWRERGYNQSELVARSLSKLCGLPVVEDCLMRPGNTAPQARSSSVSERRDNVARAFRCNGRGLKGKRVILMDDVSTSGATLNSCAAVLKSAGAVEVWGLVIALEL
jgi:ComF family protein